MQILDSKWIPQKDLWLQVSAQESKTDFNIGSQNPVGLQLDSHWLPLISLRNTKCTKVCWKSSILTQSDSGQDLLIGKKTTKIPQVLCCQILYKISLCNWHTILLLNKLVGLFVCMFCLGGLLCSLQQEIVFFHPGDKNLGWYSFNSWKDLPVTPLFP